MICGHSIVWICLHEAWHFVLSLSFSLVLLSVVYFLSSGTFWQAKLVYQRIPLISIFLLSVSLASCWHYILDIGTVARALRFWW